MPFACTVTEVYIQVIGGTNAAVNVWTTGTQWLRNGHQTVTPSSLTALSPLQNQAIAQNDSVFPYISSLSGAVTQVAWTIRFTRP
jgi:hypothetical protein